MILPFLFFKMGEVEDIIGHLEDDVIKRASFLLFMLVKKESVDYALEKTSSYLKKKGWLLKVDDKEFLEKINHKSLRDVEKWVDYNMKRIRS